MTTTSAVDTTMYDVIIVGAGFAGLAAAEELLARNPRSSIRILEGLPRAGGRTLTAHPALGHLEFGGQFLARQVRPDGTWDPKIQEEIYSMVGRHGIALLDSETPTDRPSLFETDDPNDPPMEYGGPDEPLPQIPDAMEVVLAIEALVATFKVGDDWKFVGKPWEHPRAAALDAISVAQWADEYRSSTGAPMSSKTKQLLTVAVRSAYSVEPTEISLLHFLHYGASCGSFLQYEIGGDSFRLKLGTGELVRKLLDTIGRQNVTFNTRVTAVDDGESFATIRAVAGGTTVEYRARHVIVAVPPHATRRIAGAAFTSPARMALLEGTRMAQTIKCFAIFREAFWKAAYAGYAISSRGPIDWVKDCSTVPDGGSEVIPTLMLFIVGAEVPRWRALSTAEQRAQVAEQLGRLFKVSPSTVESLMTHYLPNDWADDAFAGGCPACVFEPGALTRDVNSEAAGKALASPVGRIHFAGSETGTKWMGGYINGAVESGIRAAREVL